MPIIDNLDQAYVDTQLHCPTGVRHIEFVDPQRTGLYIEVTASKPGQGTYYLRYKDAAKKTARVRIGRTTEINLEEARAAVRNLKATLVRPSSTSAGAPVSPVSAGQSADGHAGMLLDDFMNDHYFPHARIHKRSHARDVQLYRRIKVKFGHRPLKSVSRLLVQQFQAALVAEGIADAHVNHHIQLMRRVLNLAVSWELLDKNVLTRFEMLKLDNQRDHHLNNEEVDQLVKVLKTDKNRLVSLALMFLLATGARLNEALHARWEHVDTTTGMWRIPALNSKSKKQKTLPLNDSAQWVLKELGTSETSPFLFPSPVTGVPFTNITRVWYRLRTKAGIPAKTRIHDLRHTFASRVVSAGRSLFEVQKLLGHSDPRTSQRYAHLSMKSAQEASNTAAFAL